MSNLMDEQPYSSEDIVRIWSEEFGMRPGVLPVEKLLALLPNAPNPHKHYHKDLAALGDSMEKAGFKNLILLWFNPETGLTEVVYGSGRITAGSEHYERLPVAWALDFDKMKAKFLRLADNRVKDLAQVYDDEIIIKDLRELNEAAYSLENLKLDRYDKFLVTDLAADDPLMEQLQPGYEAKVNVPTIARKIAAEAGPVQPLPLGTEDPDLHPPLPPVGSGQPAAKPDDVPTWHDRPNITFPSDNEYGIPTLSLKYQAEVIPKPVVKWGEISRTAKMAGMWHFYVEDSKFKNLHENPNAPLMSGATVIAEPNYSIHAQDVLAVVLYWTYWKRWLNRYWQSKGVRTMVDLWVAGAYSEINFIGVPKGWRAYCIRGNSSMLDYIEAMYMRACDQAGTEDNILYLVYGGGQATKARCEEYGQDWTWVPERLQVVSNPALAGADGLENKVAYDEFKDIKS